MLHMDCVLDGEENSLYTYGVVGGKKNNVGYLNEN